MLATLDPETQREWVLITASRADTPTTAELVTFMESRCRAFGLLQTTQSLKEVPNISRSSQLTGNKVSKPYSNVSIELLFSLCNGSYRLFNEINLSKYKLNNTLNLSRNRDFFQLLATIYEKSHKIETSEP